ncbi:hypothetical protein AHF37_04954, partial [Paragonimus kellicotti]
VIQSNAKTGYVPRSFLIGKRIAQCLHPALPPGVHCKALECYDAIFRTIGLFALLGLSAMTVKPPLFDIFEEHLLPLGTSLHPAFMGLLQGILPGLEQGAEFSERGNRMMEMFCAAVGPKFFYTCLWKLLIDVPSVRHILLESLCCLFGDSILLVQRDALDFLQIALPIHLHASPNVTIANGPLSTAELSALCSCALSVLLRRDASLNRRLFTWLRGTTERSVAERPFRIVSGLLDRIDLGGSIIECLLPEILWYTYAQFHALQQRSDAWFSNEAATLIGSDMLCQFKMRTANDSTECEQSAVENISNMIMDQSTERSVAERPFRIVSGLLDRIDLGGSIIECLLPEILWYTYAQFHALQQRSDAWFSNEAATLIGSDMLCQFKMRTANDSTECEQSAVENISNMIMDHVRAKDSTKSVLTLPFVELSGFICLLIRLGTEDHGSRTLQPVSGSGNPVGDFTDFENHADLMSSAPTADHPIEAKRVPTKSGRLNAADEFLRTAHLFLTNLDGTFLWSLMETQFTRLLDPCLPPTTAVQPRLIHWSQKPFELHLNELCRVVHFLLEHLPIDTYPGVCSYHLPRIASHLITCLTTRIQKSSTSFISGDVSLPALTIIELSSVLKVLESMVGKILEHVMTMFDRSTVFSVDSVTKETKTASSEPTSASTSHRDLTVLASTIGYFRQFLAAFCVHILGFSPNKQGWKADRSQFQLGEYSLPEWLVCLLYASTELDCFDLKAVSLYTLLELFAASTSVNGWNVDNKNPTSEVPRAGKMRLILPVLSGRLLTYLIRKTSLFSRVGISLWSYLSPSHSSFHEDAAHLLVRLHQLYPPTPSSLSDGVPPGCPTGIGSSVEAYILSQMLSADLNLQVDAQARFALLWHLIRPSPLSCFHHETTAVNWNGLPATSRPFPKPTSSMTKSKLANFAKSIAAPCWRRSPLIAGDRVDASAIHSTHSSGLQSIPFYRCALLLLDNLDVDNPWGPVGSVGTAVCSFAAAFPGADVTESSAATQISGLIRSVLREQSVQWMCRALRTGQVDRLMAPVLAALLHPATVRISLKARVLLANRWFTQRQGPADLEQKESESKGVAPPGTSAVSFTLSTENIAEDPIRSSTQTPRKSESKNGGDVFDANCQTTDMMSVLQSRLRLITCKSNADQEARIKRLHAARQTMVSELLGGLLSMPLLQPLDASCTDASNSSVAAVEGDHAPTMLPLHEHLVIHLQNHDANQMVYALSRIRAILTIAPNLFLLALSSCSLHGSAASDPVNSPLCLFGLTLAELLTRHRRALAGGNFYGPTNSDEVSQTLQTQSNLLEVVINLCLLIMCSQLPFASSTQSIANGSPVHCAPYGNRYEFTENEFRANKCAQKTAAEVLELIVKELVNIQNFSGMLDLSGRAERSTLGSSHSTEGPKYTLITGRRLVECTLKNTCLISAVLHCLASALEVAHWPVEPGRWLSTLDAAESASLPMCLRLLLVNELSANLPATFHTVYLCSLIRLTQAVLKLHPWSADRIEATPPRSLMSNTIWPYNYILGSGISPETSVQAPSFPVDQSEAASLLDPNRLLDIWLRGFVSLPACFSRELLFRTACLTVHWDCASMMSSHPSREQGALLLDIMSLALSCPTLPSKSNFIAEPSGFTARCDLHPVWYQFVFATLASWGLYTPHLTRIVVSQLCANLSSLTEHAQLYSDLKNSAESEDLCIPADYTLASLACLQGIYHALLLPGGSTASAAWLRRSSLPDIDQSRGAAGAMTTEGSDELVLSAAVNEAVTLPAETMANGDGKRSNRVGTLFPPLLVSAAIIVVLRLLFTLPFLLSPTSTSDIAPTFATESGNPAT